jgi:D-sedoheptulose 7-phosphate isomerase
MREDRGASAECIRTALGDSSDVLARAADALSETGAAVAAALVDALKAGGKVLFCGNGGSAADAQHLAAELAGRLRLERRALPAVALTVNASTLTAVANDYGYEAVFARQVEGLGKGGDVLIGISTSGSSANVVAALKAAKAAGLVTVGLLGESGGAMEEYCDHLVRAPSRDTQRIQELHIAIGHAICAVVEEELFKG